MSFLPVFCFMSSSLIIEENPSNSAKVTMEEPAANHLFSSFVTLCALLLIYFPCYFLQIAFSPLLISTAILLLSLLRLGANQIQRIEVKTESCFSGTCEIPSDPTEKYIESLILVDKENDVLDLKPPIGWSIGAPLEVIYEDYEGEEEEDEEIDFTKDDRSVSKLERYPSLSLYYPETDSDGSSTNGDIQDSGEWESPERMFFRWDEEDRDGLIDIALDCKIKCDLFHDEDENLIEIDIFPAKMRTIEFSGDCHVD